MLAIFDKRTALSSIDKSRQNPVFQPLAIHLEVEVLQDHARRLANERPPVLFLGQPAIGQHLHRDNRIAGVEHNPVECLLLCKSLFRQVLWPKLAPAAHGTAEKHAEIDVAVGIDV